MKFTLSPEYRPNTRLISVHSAVNHVHNNHIIDTLLTAVAVYWIILINIFDEHFLHLFKSFPNDDK